MGLEPRGETLRGAKLGSGLDESVGDAGELGGVETSEEREDWLGRVASPLIESSL